MHRLSNVINLLQFISKYRYIAFHSSNWIAVIYEILCTYQYFKYVVYVVFHSWSRWHRHNLSQTLWYSFQKSDDVDAIKTEIEECGGLDTMEAYQDHEDKDLVDKVNEILYNYFSDSLDLDLPIPLFEDIDNDCNENYQDK